MRVAWRLSGIPAYLPERPHALLCTHIFESENLTSFDARPSFVVRSGIQGAGLQRSIMMALTVGLT